MGGRISPESVDGLARNTQAKDAARIAEQRRIEKKLIKGQQVLA